MSWMREGERLEIHAYHKTYYMRLGSRSESVDPANRAKKTIE